MPIACLALIVLTADDVAVMVIAEEVSPAPVLVSAKIASVTVTVSSVRASRSVVAMSLTVATYLVVAIVVPMMEMETLVGAA